MYDSTGSGPIYPLRNWRRERCCQFQEFEWILGFVLPSKREQVNLIDMDREINEESIKQSRKFEWTEKE